MACAAQSTGPAQTVPRGFACLINTSHGGHHIPGWATRQYRRALDLGKVFRKTRHEVTVGESPLWQLFFVSTSSTGMVLWRGTVLLCLREWITRFENCLSKMRLSSYTEAPLAMPTRLRTEMAHICHARHLSAVFQVLA